MRRYAILAAALVIELLLGFQYTWGVFDRVLQEEYGFAASQAQAVLAAQIVMFAVTFLAAGWVLHHFGPRVTTVAGGLIYGASLILGGIFGRNPTVLFWSTGVLFGVGLALGYICPLVTCQKWFPRYKGAITGLVVGFYGGGSFLLAAVTKALMASGLTAFQVLTFFGVVSAAGIVLMGLTLTNPPGEINAVKRGRFPKGILRTGHFWALVAGYFAGTCAGLSIVGSIERIGRTLGTPGYWFEKSVMAFAIGNTCGRLVWGVLSEILGTRRAVALALVSQSACIIMMIFLGAYGPAFVVLTLFIGFNYGANFVLFVSDVSKTYGADRVGSVFAMVNIAYVASGLFGAPSAGFSFDRWNSYVPSMCAAATLTFAGAVLFLVLYGRAKAPPEEVG